MIQAINDDLQWAHPLVQDWFINKFGSPTEPQQLGWPSILAGQTTLISAPTGSGKTFAAFLVCIDRLVRQALASKLNNCTEVLYISPLKALSNDIQKNLLAPLAEIRELATARGLVMQEIFVAVRTGDTPQRERRLMLNTPPHILVTTPESFYILLTAEKSRQILTDIGTIIVDEIHSLVNDKRGAHLSLSLERLAVLSQRPAVRIGLSATQKPIELVADFLTGPNRSSPTIVDIGHIRKLDLAIETPVTELGPIATNEMWDEIYERLVFFSNDHRSILVFVNTRRLAERVAHHLAKRLGEENVAAHHGSLSRKIRLAAENKLKNGELKILVATASLELGIDIGTIDLVCQLGSPRSISIALQRIGRAGHWRGAVPKGRIFAMTRDELIECAALVKAIRERNLDALIIPEQPLDILAQQIVATCATGEWREDDLFNMVKNSFSYSQLSPETFNSVITMLSEGMAGARGRYGAYLFRDQVNGMIRARRGSRLVAITSGGAIPENGLFTVVAEPEQIMVGTLDEDFAVESNRGDIILLGNTSWQIKRIESASGRVIVEDMHGAPPTVPFWRGEAPTRTAELSLAVAQLREKVNELLPDCLALDDLSNQLAVKPVRLWLQEECGLNQYAAEQIIKYIFTGRQILGAIPTQDVIIAERFFDEAGGMQLIIHAPFGARINKAWGLALRKRFCRSFNFELQAAATDDGLNISLAEQHSFPLADVFRFLHPNSIKKVLIQAVLQSPLFTTRWRWDATRALALRRFNNGKKIPPNIQRMLADDLLAAVFPDAAACQDNLAGKEIEPPDHPLINETMKDVLTEALDLNGFIELLHKIVNNEIQCLSRDTPTPSPFAHEILNSNPYAFLDDAPLEERRARAVELRRMLPQAVLQEIGRLDPAIISEVVQEVWPDVRNADELHDALQTLVALPENIFQQEHFVSLKNQWQKFMEQLILTKRAATATYRKQIFWVVVEKAKTFASIYPTAVLNQSLITVEKTITDRLSAIEYMLRGWLQHIGPVTVIELSEMLQLASDEVEAGLLKLETSGQILRGQFRTTNKEIIEWCERRILAKIHRQTINKLRKEIEPVTAEQFIRWLLTWQHLAPQTQLSGEQGLIEIIRQLQGFEIPANAWENQIFTKRLQDYDRQLLDRLCLMGVIGWGRLSPHPRINSLASKKDLSAEMDRPLKPTSIAPITFFLREDFASLCLVEKPNDEETLPNLSHTAITIYHYLQQKGASFFADIARAVAKLPVEIETGLWELTAAGLVTADSFDNLRAFLDSRRRLGKKRQRREFFKPRQSAGRWSLLRTDEHLDRDQKIEKICKILLKRYGVVFRDLLARETLLPPWRELLVTFRRLEDKGEIRGGRFVSGFSGQQFALSYAVDSLRAFKQQKANDLQIKVTAVDPINLLGIILPGQKVRAVSGKSVILADLAE